MATDDAFDARDSDGRPAGADEPEPAFETTYEYGDQIDGLTVTIVDGVATVRDVSPMEIVPRVAESVDPDALERIFRPLPDGTRRRGSVTFYLVGCRITVDSEGVVRIYDDAGDGRGR
ncbi:MAG: HalOD1 output domain-containing protein [Haloarculaceae archaeon]